MNVKRNFTIMLTAMLVIAVISTAAWAKKPVPEPTCSLAGSWAGDAEGDLGWYGIHTSTDGTKGEMLMNWVYNSLISDANYEMVPGTGVWELTDSDTATYNFTWYSQIKSAETDPEAPFYGAVIPVRVSGTAQMNGCDEVIINYLFEIEVKPSEFADPDWVTFDTGIAYEYRMQVYTPQEAQ